jgi:hypothetical protein
MRQKLHTSILTLKNPLWIRPIILLKNTDMTTIIGKILRSTFWWEHQFFDIPNFSHMITSVIFKSSVGLPQKNLGHFRNRKFRKAVSDWIMKSGKIRDYNPEDSHACIKELCGMRRHVGIKLFTKIIWNNLIVSNHKWLISSHEALYCNCLIPWFCYSNQHCTKHTMKLWNWLWIECEVPPPPLSFLRSWATPIKPSTTAIHV